MLRALPEGILPHVPVPLRYCDVLSDGYARGGVEAVLALRGLFVLMTRHHLEYPHLYKQLYAVLTAEAPSASAEDFFDAQSELHGILAVQGQSAADRGSHSLSIRPVERRQ